MLNNTKPQRHDNAPAKHRQEVTSGDIKDRYGLTVFHAVGHRFAGVCLFFLQDTDSFHDAGYTARRLHPGEQTDSGSPSLQKHPLS